MISLLVMPRVSALAGCDSLAQVISSIVSDVQTDFIRGRQIIDGPLMVDEIISWGKKTKRRLMFLKVDFEKAFDTLNWNFLDSILLQMGFSPKWRSWIKTCLNSGFGSVLVNGSPTKEFPIKRGLRQVNFAKSKLYGIGVTLDEKAVLASHIGCQSSVFPCTYLGLPIGASMSRTPQKIIQELESLRRAFFWGGSVEDKKIAWVAWDKNFLPFDKGGLGINSLKSCNLSLLSKWWWRFYNEPNALWVSVIKSIHGDEGGLSNFEAMKVKTGPWFHIARLKEDFLRLNININSIFKKSVCNEELTSFWNDRRPPRSGPESTQLTELEELTCHLRVTDGSDFRSCLIDNKRVFSVSGMRNYISEFQDQVQGHAPISIWNKFVPIKVNILSWRIGQKRLPTRLNLDHRGIDLDSLICPCCNEDQESKVNSTCLVLVRWLLPFGKQFSVGGGFLYRRWTP
ncbi:RNA-directed DNA polymerase, eukaryota, reverse transcriptase zinc-binding domain protein [Tanacetum coccineum]